MTYDPVDANDDGVVESDVNNQSVNTDDLSNAVAFAREDTASAGINEAVNRLPAEGGTVLARRGSHALSEQPLLPDNVTLILPSGCTLYPESDFSAQNKPTVNGLDIVSVVTNSDHSAGNANVKIKGEGRIHDDNDNLDPSDSLAGVMLYQCEQSTVEGIEADHIGDNISQEGGPSGDNRFFAMLLLECDNCDMDDVYGHDTGDDTLGIRRSSTDCEITDSRAHGAKFGHAIQSASTTIFGSPNGPNTEISVLACDCGPVDGSSKYEAGVSYHNTVGGEIKNCKISGTGSGVLTLDGTKDIDIDCRVTDANTIGYYLEGTPNMRLEGYIKQTQDTNFDAVRINDFRGGTSDIDVDVTVQSTATRDKDVADIRGVRVADEQSNTIEDISIDVVAIGLSEIAADVLAINSGTVRDINITVTARECGRAVRLIETTGSVSDCVVNGGTIRESGETFYGVGVLFSGVTDCICQGVRANVSGAAFLEESDADFNLFDTLNGRGSGTELPQTVGTNTKVGDVQP